MRRGFVVAFLFVFATRAAEARITKLVINRIETPTFEGASFDGVGQYKKLTARAFGEIDPADRRNAVITDLSLAPRNSRGMVGYSTDVIIIAPVDASKGNHRVLFEVNNRGNLNAFGQLNNATTGGNDPTTALDAGNGFLMRYGYTVVSCGWDVTAVTGGGRLTITVPVATNPDGSAITGPSLEEFVIDNTTTTTGSLTYPAATLDKSKASLTRRTLYSESPITIPATDWEYVNAQTIRLRPAGTAFENGRLYEFSYVAKNPIVAGLGFAAVRDVASFLRSAQKDDGGNSNPLAADVQHVYTYSFSQPARFLHDFLRLGFNESEEGQRVFDANLNWVAGASGGFFNYRFAQPSRTHRQHIGRWYPERQFPFTYQTIFDPVSGKVDGLLRACATTDTCPSVFEVNSENEYWSKSGSLLHTDTLGNDLALSHHNVKERVRERRDENAELEDMVARGESFEPRLRYYTLASLPHSSGVGPTGKGICQQPRNPLVANPTLRALLVALDVWVSSDVQPPANAIPRRANGTLVPSLPQEGVGFPDIPGVNYNGRLAEGDLLDFGSGIAIRDGILNILPPKVLGSPYPALVPKTDADGNDVAGVRTVEIEAPIATYTGWGLRAGPAAGEGCDAAGQMINFPATKAERLANGDPRLSIEERYPTHAAYVNAITNAARALQKRGFLLEEDVQRYIAAAEASDVGK